MVAADGLFKKERDSRAHGSNHGQWQAKQKKRQQQVSAVIAQPRPVGGFAGKT
jgi:hypothetical protein